MTHSQSDKATFGFWLYLMSDCVLFAGLFAAYAVLHTHTYGHSGIESIFNLPFVLGETLLLLTSSFTAGLALLYAHRGKKRFTLVALAATLVLGLGFLGMEGSEFARLIVEGNGPAQSAFLSAFFALLGTHGLHVLLGALWMLVIMAHIMRKPSTNDPMVLGKLACLAMFWHFLDVIWICIFTFVYLYGAL